VAARAQKQRFEKAGQVKNTTVFCFEGCGAEGWADALFYFAVDEQAIALEKM
jgi:hypothetical protein